MCACQCVSVMDQNTLCEICNTCVHVCRRMCKYKQVGMNVISHHACIHDAHGWANTPIWPDCTYLQKVPMRCMHAQRHVHFYASEFIAFNEVCNFTGPKQQTPWRNQEFSPRRNEFRFVDREVPPKCHRIRPKWPPISEDQWIID